VHRHDAEAGVHPHFGKKKSDIKLIAASLPSCTFRHISRGLNGAAHLLARYCENSVF
jgi:hypothetical protein